MKITFCEALAREEGFLVADSRSRRNHNPGNICWGKFAMLHGATSIEQVPNGEIPRFAYFPNDQVGFNAMSSLLEASYLGLTISATIYRWAPPTENDTEQYIKNVCSWTGLTPNTILTSNLLSAPLATEVIQ